MRLVEHASPHVSSPPVADKASHGRSPSGTHHASGELSSCKRTSVPRDWMHTGGGSLGRCRSPVDRPSRDPVYGLRPPSIERAFSWRVLAPPQAHARACVFGGRRRSDLQMEEHLHACPLVRRITSLLTTYLLTTLRGARSQRPGTNTPLSREVLGSARAAPASRASAPP